MQWIEFYINYILLGFITIFDFWPPLLQFLKHFSAAFIHSIMKSAVE